MLIHDSGITFSHSKGILITPIGQHWFDVSPGSLDAAEQVVRNAVKLGEELLARGYDLVTGGTDTHCLLVDLRPKDLSGKEAENRLLEVGIVVNKNLIPGDPRPAMETSGLRLGTPAVTTRGMKEGEMTVLADLLDRSLTGGDPGAVGAKVEELAEAFPLP